MLGLHEECTSCHRSWFAGTPSERATKSVNSATCCLFQSVDIFSFMHWLNHWYVERERELSIDQSLHTVVVAVKKMSGWSFLGYLVVRRPRDCESKYVSQRDRWFGWLSQYLNIDIDARLCWIICCGSCHDEEREMARKERKPVFCHESRRY